MNNSQLSSAAKEMLARIKLKWEEALFIAQALSILVITENAFESEGHYPGRVTKLIFSLKECKQSSQQLVIDVKDFLESLEGKEKLEFLETSSNLLGGLDRAIHWADRNVARSIGGPTVTFKQS